jgi:hypothetical protein
MIEEHFLDEVLAATQEYVANIVLLLNDAAQQPLDMIGFVFEDALNFIKDEDDFAFRISSYPGGCRKDLFDVLFRLGTCANAKGYLWFSFVIQAHARCEP